MIFKCCNGCPDRVVGCHGGCERYNKAKDDYAEIKKRLKTEADIYSGECNKKYVNSIVKEKMRRSRYGNKNFRF